MRRGESGMNPEPSVKANGSGMCLTVQVGGDMDYKTASFFRNRLLEETQGQRCVVLDLSAVSFCDSAGLNVLLMAWRRADQAGAVLALACVPLDLQRVLVMTGMDTVLQVYGTVAEAKNGLVVGGGT
ncbi:STAS domain-containing protein [Streptomyces sp. NPDC058985]|uniref:STAS domain-containing protein n=1 Tax=Streptomyces sp. NPDC058985 TaxID=3346684 RepID=UPI0036CF4846